MIHHTIKAGIADALRSKDTLRLEVLRGLNALAQNELLAGTAQGESLPDDKMLALIKRSAKQRKDSIEQFEKGGRMDLANKEKAELEILNTFLPTLMSRAEVDTFVIAKIESLRTAGTFDPKAAGKLIGILMKELAGKADGADVKAAVEDASKKLTA